MNGSDHGWQKLLALVIAGAMIASSGPAAAADQNSGGSDADTIAESLERVESLDPTLILDPVESSRRVEDAEVVNIGTGSVEVPRRLEAGVEITGWVSESFVIGLPLAGGASAAVKVDDGTFAYPSPRSSNTVVVSATGLQLLTIIDDPSAPTDFVYELALESGQSLQKLGDGAQVIDSAGSTVVLIAPAWAKDAEGRDVPTSYSVSGNTLIQTIDHTSNPVSYPIVADPIFIAPWVFRCLLGLGLNGPQIVAAFASGTIWGGLGRAALACALGK